MVAQRLKKIKLLFYVAFTLNRNILIIFFSFLFFFLSSFPFLPIASLFLVLTLRFYPLSPTKSLPSADHSLRSPQLHPLSLCYLMPSANVGLYLAFSLSRSPPQRPNLQAPPSLCYLMPSTDVGLCLCFPISCGQWACVRVCGSGLVFSGFWAFWCN